MNGTSDGISLIIFALLAGFVIWKLRSVLGTRVGNERPPYDPFAPPGPSADSKTSVAGDENRVVRLPGAAPDGPGGGQARVSEDRWSNFAKRGSETWAGLDAIAAIDPSFDPENFLRGAAVAYDMIILAFARADREALGNLLSPEVYESFDKAIRELEAKGEKKETTIVSTEPGVLEEAHLKDDVAQLSVRFVATLITVTRDRDGAVVDGSPEKGVGHVDIWTFARSMHSNDPNWKLVATQSAA